MVREVRTSTMRAKTPTHITWTIGFLSYRAPTPGLVTRTLDAHVIAIELLASEYAAAPKPAEEDIKVVHVELRTIACVFRISDVCVGALIENVIHGSVARAAFSRS